MTRLEMMTVGVLVALPVLTGVWASVWSMIFKALRGLASLVIVTKTAGEWQARSVLLQHLAGRTWSGGDEEFDATPQHVASLGRSRVVFRRNVHHGWYVLRVGWIPVLYVEAKTDSGRFIFVRGTLNWDRMLRDVEDRHDEWRQTETQRRFLIQRVAGVEKMTYNVEKDSQQLPVTKDGSLSMRSYFWPDREFKPDMHGSMLDDLALTDDLRAVVADVRYWAEHHEWYRDRCVPWRRGYLLHGAPGTGKTSLVRALAEDLDIPVTIMELSSMSDETFQAAWKSLRTHTGRSYIVLWEDFDAVFQGRERVNPQGKLSFDVVLNAIDGMERHDGLLLFVTTNDPGAIDPALGAPLPGGGSTRPGRIDMTVEFGPLDGDGRLKVARRVLRDEGEAVRVAALGEGLPAARFQELCCQEALAHLWRRKA